MKNNIDSNKTKKLINFFVILICIIGTYYAIILFFNKEIFEPYLRFNAYLSGLLIKLFDNNVVVENTTIITQKISMILSFGCEGSEALVIFLAGVIAFPADLKYKLKGVLIGGSLLYFLNLLRVLILYLVASIDVSLFDIFHNEILPILYIVISVIAWYFWLKYIPVK